MRGVHAHILGGASTSATTDLLEAAAAARASASVSVSESGGDLESSAFPATTAAARGDARASEAPAFKVACLAGQSYARPDDRTPKAIWLQSFINDQCGDAHAVAASASALDQAAAGPTDLDPHSSESQRRTAACVEDYTAMTPGIAAGSNSSDAFCRCRPLLLLRLRQARQLFNMLSLGPAGLCLLLLLGTRFLLKAKKAYTRIG